MMHRVWMKEIFKSLLTLIFTFTQKVKKKEKNICIDCMSNLIFKLFIALCKDIFQDRTLCPS